MTFDLQWNPTPEENISPHICETIDSSVIKQRIRSLNLNQPGRIFVTRPSDDIEEMVFSLETSFTLFFRDQVHLLLTVNTIETNTTF